MVEVADSSGTADLEMDSLKLDVKVLQQNREDDRKEFQTFQATVNNFFSDVQKLLVEMQSSFTLLITALHPREGFPEMHGGAQGSLQQHTPQAPFEPPQEVVHPREIHFRTWLYIHPI